MKILHFILPLLIFSFLACYAEENDVEINKRDDEEILASEDIGEISVDFIDQWERSNSSIDSLNDIAIGKSISKKKLGDYYQGGQLIEPDYVYRITNVETSENLYLFASRKDKSNDKWLVISTYAFPKGQTMAGFSYMLI
ncbi:MAG: hypothetical protein PQJ50_06130, partial [Spirochaetales bacterium]|nr:hypothetical protein [Spirochaetales bacterium]